MQTDLAWVEDLHARLAVRYGDKWAKMWDGFSLDDMAIVRQDWANVLSGCTTAGLLYALDNLPPSWPPNVGEFFEIVKRRPVATAQQQALTGPPADPARVARVVAATRSMGGARNALQWAVDLRGREERGERLTESQRMAWRNAIGGKL